MSMALADPEAVANMLGTGTHVTNTLLRAGGVANRRTTKATGVKIDDSDNIQMAANTWLGRGAAASRLYWNESNGDIEYRAITGGHSFLEGNVGIGARPLANSGLMVESGTIALKETTTPSADAGYGKFYNKASNRAFFQDGAGVEHGLSVDGHVHADVIVAAVDSVQSTKDTAGFLCDGTDDDVQIQAAIASLPATGGTVRLASGSFTISATVTLPDNTHLFIGSGALVALAAASDTDMFTNSDTVGGNVNITVSGGGVVDGNGPNQSGADRDNFTFTNVTRLTLAEFTTQNSLGWGLHTFSCTTIRVLEITAPGPSSRGGIQVDGDDCLIQNCVANDHTTGDGYGLWLAGNQMDVISCHASGNDDDNLVVSGDEVRVFGGSFNDSVSDKGCHVTSTASNVTIIGSEFSGNALSGIECSPGNVTLRGCHLVGNGENGAWINHNNNVIDGCLIEENAQRGIRSYYDTPDGMRVMNCTIRNNGQSGIELDNNTNCQITGNHIYDDQGGPTQDYAVKINNTSAGPIVVTNNLFGPQQTGEVLSNGTDDRVWGNNTTADSYVKINTTTRVLLTTKIEYGDADVSWSSQDDGYLDGAANLGIRLATPGIKVSEDAWLGTAVDEARFVFDHSAALLDAAVPLFRVWPDAGPGVLAIRRGDANGHLIQGGTLGVANGLEYVTVGGGIGHGFYVGGSTLVADILSTGMRIGAPATHHVALSANGDLSFNGDNAGMLYGEVFVKDNATATTLNSTGGKIQFLFFDTDGESNGVTPDHANDHVTIVTAGRYRVTMTMSVANAAGASHLLDVSVWKNNGATEFLNIHQHRTLAAGTDTGALSMTGIVDLAASDTIEAWMDTDRAVNTDVVVSDCVLNVEQIGGT